MEYELNSVQNGIFDITKIIELTKGDKLIVEGIEQVVKDVHEGDVLVSCENKEIGYDILIDEIKYI